MKKGFTLIELLAVIIILAIIALITFPIVDNSIKNSKQAALERTIGSIEEAAHNYSSQNNLGYPEEEKAISLDELKSSGFLTSDITNPVTNEEMTGCVLYRWDEAHNQYVFRYDEECDSNDDEDVALVGSPIEEKAKELVYENNACKTDGTTYQYMGGCYIKGNPNNNYIWYSGFLWRIMGINADGTIRMITEDNVTAIPWGADDTAQDWDGSHAKDWLNNYFYPRLKGNNIITEQVWCSETTSGSSVRTTCTNNLSKEFAKVGLITIDEYNLAGGRSSYLNIDQYQWTMTPDNSSHAWNVISGGSKGINDVSNTYGLRAVINVNSDVTITGGNGTLGATWSSQTGPYILNEDKSVEVTGKLNEKATSGEYVLFVGRKYRVVDKDSNGNTKLILDSYYEETEGTVYTMSYGSNNTFSKDTGIGQKLNSDVLNWLTNNSESEKAKLVSDYTWYQNNFASGQSYSVSLNEENPTRSIQATVGLIRVGEMLSGQSSSILTKGYTTASSYSNANTYWTMTPYTSSSSAWRVDRSGSAVNNSVTRTGGLRAVIVVTADVTITGGNGTWSNPYQI